MAKTRDISSAKRVLLGSKIAAVKIEETGEAETLKRVYKEGLSDEYYETHPVLMGRDREFIEAVIWIDQETTLTSSSSCHFGAQAQRELGVLMTEIASTLAKVVSKNMPSDLKIILDNLKKLDAENFKDKEVFRLFWNKKVPCTVQDYITAFDAASSEVETSARRLEEKIIAAGNDMDRLEILIKNQHILSTRIKHYIAAGKIMYSRYSPKREYEMLMDQFLKRITDLETFLHVSEISMAQAAINYQNCSSQVRDSFSVVQTTLPIWKSRYAQLLSKWNLNGAKNDTPLSEAQNDKNFKEVLELNETFYTDVSEPATKTGTDDVGPM